MSDPTHDLLTEILDAVRELREDIVLGIPDMHGNRRGLREDPRDRLASENARLDAIEAELQDLVRQAVAEGREIERVLASRGSAATVTRSAP